MIAKLYRQLRRSCVTTWSHTRHSTSPQRCHDGSWCVKKHHPAPSRLLWQRKPATTELHHSLFDETMLGCRRRTHPLPRTHAFMVPHKNRQRLERMGLTDVISILMSTVLNLTPFSIRGPCAIFPSCSVARIEFSETTSSRESQSKSSSTLLTQPRRLSTFQWIIKRFGANGLAELRVTSYYGSRNHGVVALQKGESYSFFRTLCWGDKGSARKHDIRYAAPDKAGEYTGMVLQYHGEEYKLPTSCALKVVPDEAIPDSVPPAEVSSLK